MPRQAKKAVQADKGKVTQKQVVEQPKRKPYPDRAARIEMAEQRIARLEKLNADRAALIERTEAKLLDRKATLEKSIAELESAVALRDRLIAANDKPARNTAGRTVKAAEKAAFDELKAKLEAQGRTLEDLLQTL